MFRRVEACFPVGPKKLADRMREDLEVYLKDDSKAWRLKEDGTYERVRPAAHPFEAQSFLLEQLKR